MDLLTSSNVQYPIFSMLVKPSLFSIYAKNNHRDDSKVKKKLRCKLQILVLQRKQLNQLLMPKRVRKLLSS